MGFWNVEGSGAYAVIAGRFTVTFRGQTVARTGTLAYTFSKHGDEWKIDAQAWGRNVVKAIDFREACRPAARSGGSGWPKGRVMLSIDDIQQYPADARACARGQVRISVVS